MYTIFHTLYKYVHCNYIHRYLLLIYVTTLPFLKLFTFLKTTTIIRNFNSMQSVRALKLIIIDTKIFNYSIAVTNIDLKNIRGKLNINKRIYVIFYLKYYYTGFG